MKVPVSWLKDFVDITLSVEELAERLTLAGLEIGGIEYIGLPGADLEWNPEKLVLAQILKVEQHPNADRLVLATVDVGTDEPEVIVTGAENLQPFKGQGDLSHLNLKSPMIREGGYVYDGHSKELKKVKLKGREIRGIMNKNMLCSPKEIGMSEEHAGIIIAQDEAAPGTSIVDIWGDAVLDIELTPNLVRCSSILGVAREVAALTDQPLRYPDTTWPETSGNSEGKVIFETTDPELNPRFTAVLIEGVEIKESPFWMQRRLSMAGMRPINNIVDISNYVMLEMGQPNHAFDWDVLRRRADGTEGKDAPVRIITRLAEADEEVLTLDGKTHKMPPFSILVTDSKSNLSIGGIMGGGESEVSDTSTNILLEAAAWNFINIRKTSQALNIFSEAAYRFSRGVHPSQALLGALRGAKLMAELAGGTIIGDVIDFVHKETPVTTVELPQSEVTRILGIEIEVAEIRRILEALEFTVEPVSADIPTFHVTVPDHRLDISSELTTGRADLIEEIARIYGYDRTPVTEIQDELPPQRNNTSLDQEERVRDLLVEVGLNEVINYRLTTPEREARLLGQEYIEQAKYVTLANPSTPERASMRHSVLSSVLDIVVENTRNVDQVALFEVGQIYIPTENDEILPNELGRLAIGMTGARETGSWLSGETATVDFFDLKGVIEALLHGLHVAKVEYAPAQHHAYYPGRVAELMVNGESMGVFGQLHPLVVEAYNMNVEADQPVLAADLDLDALLAQSPEGYKVQSVPRFPPVQQDIALVVDEGLSAEKVRGLIDQTGGPLLTQVNLFDVYRHDHHIGVGKKSLAYSLTFQSDEKTLTDKAVAKLQTKIVKRLENEIGAKLRG